jgi:hypothetical protein
VFVFIFVIIFIFVFVLCFVFSFVFLFVFVFPFVFLFVFIFVFVFVFAFIFFFVFVFSPSSFLPSCSFFFAQVTAAAAQLTVARLCLLATGPCPFPWSFTAGGLPDRMWFFLWKLIMFFVEKSWFLKPL